MKNAEMHKAFSKAKIRDFLAQQLERGYKGNWGRPSREIEEEIANLQERLKIARQYEAVLELTKAEGWDFWDISDEIEDYHSDTYMPFVGTEEEYDSLIKNLKN